MIILDDEDEYTLMNGIKSCIQMKQERRIRILYLAHEDRMQGGANRSLLALIKGVQNWVEPIVVTPHRTEIYRAFSKANIRCLILPIPQQIQPGSEPFWLRLMKYPLRIIKKEIEKHLLLHGLHQEFPNPNMIDIVHSNTAVIGIGMDVARMLGAKHVWHLREFIDLDHGFKLMGTWKQMRRAVSRSDATISISQSVQKHFLKTPQKFDVCIYNAVVPSWEGGLIPSAKEREKAFLFVGALKESKGIEVALRVFMRFYKTHLDWKLYIVGIGQHNYEGKLKKMCEESGCSNAVYFEGYQNNTSLYYLRCRAFLMCSRMEALGRTTIEAMNYGCVPIGRATGGTKELLIHKKTGLLFHTENELLDMMEDMVCNSYDIIRNDIHNYAQENFTDVVYGKSIFNLYNGLLMC